VDAVKDCVGEMPELVWIRRLRQLDEVIDVHLQELGEFR
jgi:hypothetical protein